MMKNFYKSNWFLYYDSKNMNVKNDNYATELPTMLIGFFGIDYLLK